MSKRGSATNHCLWKRQKTTAAVKCELHENNTPLSNPRSMYCHTYK